MVDLELVTHLLSKRCFADAIYFATLSAIQTPSARAHMLAGIACCGCVEPLATAQRLLEGAAKDRTFQVGPLLVSPMSRLPYEGFFHLIQALRLDPSITAPASLRPVADEVADDMAYVSRRELHFPRSSASATHTAPPAWARAMLLRRLAGSDRELPGMIFGDLGYLHDGSSTRSPGLQEAATPISSAPDRRRRPVPGRPRRGLVDCGADIAVGRRLKGKTSGLGSSPPVGVGFRKRCGGRELASRVRHARSATVVGSGAWREPTIKPPARTSSGAAGYSSANLSDGPKLSISVEIPRGPAGFCRWPTSPEFSASIGPPSTVSIRTVGLRLTATLDQCSSRRPR